MNYFFHKCYALYNATLFYETTFTAIGSFFFFIREHFNLNKVAQITKIKANMHSVYLLCQQYIINILKNCYVLNVF